MTSGYGSDESSCASSSDAFRFSRAILMMAVINKHNTSELVKILLDAGADAKAKNNNGKTALDLAKEFADSAEVVKLLEEKL